MSYDGFISYSHAADDLLAPRLQSGLQRFAKPWWKRRALRVFRDESSLSANPHLWESITEALDTSGWFVLLLSPDAAASEWVNQEVAYWVEHKDSSRILPVVTAGEFGWADGDVTGDAVPGALRGVFASEPRWVDLRFAKGEEQLDLQDPRFADAIADVASAMRGVPKDELAGEEVRQHRRTVRTAWAAGVLLLMLALTSVFAGVVAARNADEAERQAQAADLNADEADRQRLLAEENAAQAEANAEAEAAARQEADLNARLAEARELAASAIGAVDDDPELAVLLALQAIRATPERAEQPVEVINALWEATARNRLVGSIATDLDDGFLVATLSADGTRMLVSDRSEAAVVDPATGEELFRYVLGTADELRSGAISPDGALVALPVADPDAAFSSQGRGLDDDPRPARLVIVSVASGEEVAVLEYPDCKQVETPAWSADGALLALSSGPEPCVRTGSDSGLWVEVLDTSDWASVLLIDNPNDEGWDTVPSWDESGGLFLFGAAPTKHLPTLDPSSAVVLEGTFGYGDVTPDGSAVVSSLWDFPEIQLHDVEAQVLLDVLPIEFFPNVPWEIRFSSEGTYVAASIRGEFVTVWDVARGFELFSVPGSNPIIDEQSGLLYTAVGSEVRKWSLLEGTSGREVIGDLGDTPWVNGLPEFQLSDTVGAFLALGAGADTRNASIRFFDRATGTLLEHRIDEFDSGPIGLPGDRFIYRIGNDWFAFDVGDGSSMLVLGCDEGAGGLCPDGTQPAERIAAVMSWDGARLAAGDLRFLNARDALVGPYSQLDAASFEQVGVWDVDDWSIYEDGESAWSLQEFSDRWAMFSDEQSDVLVLDPETGKVLWEAPVSVQMTGADAQRGLLWVYGPVEGLLRVLDPETWSERQVDLRALGNVRTVSFSTDGSLLAVGDQDRLVIFDADSAELRQSIPIGGVSDVLWLDETTIVIGTTSGLWAKVSLDPNELVASALAGVTRTFRPDECSLYRIDPCPTLDELQDR